MNRADIATKILTSAERIADRIDPPTYGVKIVWDNDYEIDGATAWGDPEDAQYAAETRAKLESGEWIVVGMIVAQQSGHAPTDETAISLWGIVTDTTDLGDAYDRWDGYKSEVIWDLDELHGYLRTVADELIAEAQS